LVKWDKFNTTNRNTFGRNKQLPDKIISLYKYQFVTHRDTASLHQNEKSVNGVQVTIAVYCTHYTEHTNTIFRDFNVKPSGHV
jgi:hypothetical protein